MKKLGGKGWAINHLENVEKWSWCCESHFVLNQGSVNSKYMKHLILLVCTKLSPYIWTGRVFKWNPNKAGWVKQGRCGHGTVQGALSAGGENSSRKGTSGGGVPGAGEELPSGAGGTAAVSLEFSAGTTVMRTEVVDRTKPWALTIELSASWIQSVFLDQMYFH